VAALSARPLAALDAARRLGIRAMGPLARPLLGTRDARVMLFGVVGLTVALVVAVAMPAWSIGVGTVALGVPHVLSDVRHLVVRRSLTRRLSLYVAVGIGVVGTLLGYGLRAALVGAGVATLFASAGRARRGLVLLALAALFAVASHGPYLADLVYAHAHNVVAVVVFVVLARGAGKRAFVPLVVLALGAAFFLHPRSLEVIAAAGGLGRAPPSLPVTELAAQLAPTVDAGLAVRLVSLFAFAQAAHYVVWLRLVPELDRDTPGPRSFQKSARALTRDLSPWLVALFVAGTVVFVAWATVDLAAARLAYLRSAFFHGYLEIAALAILACEGLPAPAPTRPHEAPRTA